MNLKEQIKKELTEDGVTIPDLGKKTKERDEWEIMHAIAELDRSKEAFLVGFDKIYQEDGGAIYLAKYSNKKRI